MDAVERVRVLRTYSSDFLEALSSYGNPTFPIFIVEVTDCIRSTLVG